MPKRMVLESLYLPPEVLASLGKGSASRDQLLVRNRELRPAFKYNLGVGFSYRFGSIMNSIVNPRFRGLNYSINL